jgi:hypothetical protein
MPSPNHVNPYTAKPMPKPCTDLNKTSPIPAQAIPSPAKLMPSPCLSQPTIYTLHSKCPD